jgi:hypothetical protein
MTDKPSKRRTKKSEPKPDVQEQPSQFFWISANHIRKIIEITAAAENISFQEAVDQYNEKFRSKVYVIAPQFPKVEVR